MKQFEDYITGRSIEEDIEELCNPSLGCNGRDREKTNDLVINFVVKYLVEYLEISSSYVKFVRRLVRMAIQKEMPDYFPARCLGDIRQTSAVVKEIIFNQQYEKEGRYVCMDFGSGSGITTAAGIIAGRRGQVDEIICVGVEGNKTAAMKSQRVLQSLFNKQEVCISIGDITVDWMFDRLAENNPLLSEAKWTKDDPIHSWISETISRGTPNFLEGDRSKSNGQDIMRRSNIIRRQRDFDPYPYVYQVSLRELKNFEERVLEGKTIMFPDFINDFYRPNLGKSTLILSAGPHPRKPILLEDTGREFDDYQPITKALERWAYVSEKNPVEKQLKLGI